MLGNRYFDHVHVIKTEKKVKKKDGEKDKDEKKDEKEKKQEVEKKDEKNKNDKSKTDEKEEKEKKAPSSPRGKKDKVKCSIILDPLVKVLCKGPMEWIWLQQFCLSTLNFLSTYSLPFK